jgi:uncharacterized protein (TIGR03790 family)
MVVYNSSASESLAVARYYMAERKIPERNRCKISVESDDAIRQDEFEGRVKSPIRKCLELAGKQKILYIVLSYRCPYALTIRDRRYSVDQFLADIWDEYSPGRPGNEVGRHPYFGRAQSQGNAYQAFVPLAAYREQKGALNLYSVWRLDAANAGLAKGLVEKAMLAEAQGLSGGACLDRRTGDIDSVPDSSYGSGDWDIHQAAELARRTGFSVVEDDHDAEFGTPPAPMRCDGAALYAGWYSLDHYNDAFSWNPGAIGIHLDSLSAANPRDGTNWVANAVRKGITITSGAVSEPFLAGLPHPDQVFLYLFEGANVGDALLRSTEWLKWMIVNIGDPLYRPFPHGLPPFNSPARQEPFLALLPQAQLGGSPCTGLLSLGGLASAAATTVLLNTDRPDLVSVPATIATIEKTNAARFTITTRGVTSQTAVRITMAAGGVSRSNTLVLYPPQSH